MIHEITAKTALHFHNKKYASNCDLNIYRGCEHKCKYCFAQYSQKYLNGDFFNDIFVKTNVAEVLDLELSKSNWKRQLIHISAVSDCYQPLEEKYKLMREVLKVLIKHKQPAFILTKSTLILRDLDLIEELSKCTLVGVGASIISLNESVQKKLEPNTCCCLERFKMLKELKKTNCKTCVFLMPIIPYLTDDIKELENVFKTAKEYNADYLISDVLNMRGNLKNYFYNFLQKEFPDTYNKIQHLYKSAYVSQDYRQKLQKFIFTMKKKYNLYSMPDFDSNIKSESNQPDLFE